MADDNGGVFDTTFPVVVLHPNFFVAKAFKGKGGKDNGDPKYSGNLGMKPDHPDLSAMKKLAAAVARAKWPNRDLKELAFPFKNGDKLADASKVKGKNGEFNRGLVIIPARSKFEPRLAAIVNRSIAEYDTPEARIKNKDKFFFGAEALVQVNFVAYDGVGNNPDGVTAYLNQVCVTGKGTRIQGTGGVSETFRGYAGSMSVEDPTKGSTADDDEIPL